MLEELPDRIASMRSALAENVAFVGDALDAIMKGIEALPPIPLGDVEVPSLALIVLGLVWWRARATGHTTTTSAASAGLSGVALWAVSALGLGSELDVTLALTLLGSAWGLAIGFPIGRALGPYRDGGAIGQPFDFLAKVPAFAYLLLVVAFFSIGNVPSVVMAALVTLFTTVRRVRQVAQWGLRGVRAFSATLNSAVMRAYGAVILASVIGAGGLGRELFRGINTVNLDLGLRAVTAIVLTTFVLDRLTDHPVVKRLSPEATPAFASRWQALQYAILGRF